ncbi:MAG: hypothetical protein LUQ29_09205 [Methylococcaceae bacterium]|nr:hypothetical protein [Methylococcaceae bacterium]MDD1643428.1 hypothetical protein [Methylococcaceae bacterium]
MTLCIEQGKGSKDRYAILSPARTLARLVEVCPCPRQNAARWLAISWLGPYRPTQHSST